MVIAFCEFNFVMKHFKFLKTVVGKGLFNLFCASMFLVGNKREVWGYVMFGGLCACGVFFILVGCSCVKSYEDKDMKKDDLKGSKTKLNTTDSATEQLV